MATQTSSVFTTLKRWGRAKMIRPFAFQTACCAIEYQAAFGWQKNFSGVKPLFSPVSPDSADLLIVAGTVTQKFWPILLQTYHQMPSPKWTLAMGVCAMSGGPYNSYHVIAGIGEKIPVDVFVPGCPPTPQELLTGIEEIRKKIKRGETALEP